MRRGQRPIVIMLSVGFRPWAPFAARTFRSYCRAHGYAFTVVRDAHPDGLPPLGSLSPAGRRHKHIYAAKAYYAWYYLQQYPRVAIVDDSCCVHPNCPPLFDVVPEGALGGVKPNTPDADETIAYLQVHRPEIEWDPENTSDYVRSAVLIYSRDAMPVFTPENIVAASDLLNCPLPHQTLTYYLCKSHHYPIFPLKETYLRLPQPEALGQDRRAMRCVSDRQLSDGYLWAVSGVYRHRYLIVTDIALTCLRAWDERCVGKWFADVRRARNAILRRLIWIGLWGLEWGRRLRIIRALYRVIGLPIDPERQVIA